MKLIICPECDGEGRFEFYRSLSYDGDMTMGAEPCDEFNGTGMIEPPVIPVQIYWDGEHIATEDMTVEEYLEGLELTVSSTNPSIDGFLTANSEPDGTFWVEYELDVPS